MGFLSSQWIYLTCCMLIAGFDLSAADLSCNFAKYLAVFNGEFVPSCKPDGLYKPIQCYSEHCWCVDEESGKEIKHTKVKSPTQPNCEYVAFAATEVDMIRVVSKEKDDKVELHPEVFMSKPAYYFPPSSSVNAQMKAYLPPALWKDFSVLVTFKPEEFKGGFIFAIMDKLESVVQFGMSLSSGDNEYTQKIVLWYTEHLEQGSTKLAEFLVPVMVDRWSKFAVGVSGTTINLFVYCHNYTIFTVKRGGSRLAFADESLLMVAHAGGVIQQPFKGEIQELFLTNNPEDAARQCDETFQRKRQENAEIETVDGSGWSSNPDMEYEEEDEEMSSGDLDLPRMQTIAPLTVDVDEDTNVLQKDIPQFATTDRLVTEAVFPMPNSGKINKPNGDTLPINGDVNLEAVRTVTGPKGNKGDTGEPGLPGTHGINGIPGLMGETGPRGFSGEKGEKGDSGEGSVGAKGEPGEAHSGKDGEKGDKGAPGESIVGPQGLPGASFIDELKNLQSTDDIELVSRLEHLAAFTGEKGEPGTCKNITGRRGADGVDGVPGSPGLPGERGRQGVQGDRGYPGIPGQAGEEGRKGDTGDMGIPGFRGVKGDTGVSGPQGLPGEPGKLITADGGEVVLLPGPRGRQGRDGERGYKGYNGEKGSKGGPGPAGSRGFPGRPGPEGLPGLQGLSGLDGFPGIPGREGKPGHDGDKGPKGEPGVGLPGPPGPPGKSYGKPFFGAEWFDESSDPDLNKMKNRVGTAGAKGTKGDTGSPGKVSYNDLVDLIPLFTMKGDKGSAGAPGSEATCTKCVGVRGHRGSRGERGFPGKKGLRGTKGETGISGLDGRDGIPGTPGSPGDSVRGPKGEPGTCSWDLCTGRGEKGDRGLGGLPGLPGLVGEEGLEGRPGIRGEKGDRGLPGLVTTTDGIVVVAGPPGERGPPGETMVGLQGPPGPPGEPGTPGRDGIGGAGAQRSYTHGYPLSDSGVLLFISEDDMSRASLAIPIGTLGFVSDQQRLYLRVHLGWQTIQMGNVVPLLETEMANVIPMWMDAPAREQYPPADSYESNEPALRLFALNEPMTGNVGGIAGADGHCYRDAMKSGIDGDFRAVLTSRLQGIDSLVFSKYRHLPVTNSKGEKILNAWSSVSDGKSDLISNTHIYTFNGTNINTDKRWSRRYIWHGSGRTGEVSINHYCQAWTSDSARELGATSSYTQGQLLDQSSHTCNSKLAVLCIEIHKQL